MHKLAKNDARQNLCFKLHAFSSDRNRKFSTLRGIEPAQEIQLVKVHDFGMIDIVYS